MVRSSTFATAGIGMARGQQVVLAPDVRIEPLIRQWAAWLMTLDPVNAAMYLVGRQRPILQSFLRHPDRHVAAAKDDRTAGGLFANLSAQQGGNVQRWLDDGEVADSSTLAVGAALLDLVKSGGGSAASVLSGGVERVHDLAGGESSQSIRLLRPVLQRSIEPGMESVAVWPGVARPHFLNTPRLTDDQRLLHVDSAFDSDQLGELLRLRHSPAPIEVALAALGLDRVGDHPAVAALLRPVEAPAVEGEHIAQTCIDFLGHCSVLFRDSGTKLLADPITPPVQDHVGLPQRLDAVLISHGHPDHLVAEALLALRDRIDLALVPATRSDSFADPSLRDCLLRLGIRNVVELRPYDQVAVRSATVTALPFQGEHGGLDIGGKTTWHIRMSTTTLILAADCACQEPAAFDGVADQFGAVDILLTAMEPRGALARWLYGPLVGRSGIQDRLDGADADAVLRLAAAVGARQVGIYGCDGPKDAGHLFGRPAPQGGDERTLDTSEREVDRLRRLAAAHKLPIFTLDRPGRITPPPGER
ncbi:MBL fold metallo-hydrolase [Amycolatopsis sp. cmx-4-83]|uniref:MBL fold metallo-hydrolase n=1 Tax=Amycolatopsis sp. cmx-4-83 TaxID=2790940 RepID=UPI0039784021